MDKLIERLKKIDGIGNKVAQKILIDLISNKDKILILDEILDEVQSSFTECPTCYFFKFNNECNFCDNKFRNKNEICVVSSILEAEKILNSKYNGMIHVLKGEINLNKNITPEQLTLQELFGRINNGVEILLALNLTFEGELTANYIWQKARPICKKVTRIARGIPLGGVLDYIDKETLEDAILNRKTM